GAMVCPEQLSVGSENWPASGPVSVAVPGCRSTEVEEELLRVTVRGAVGPLPSRFARPILPFADQYMRLLLSTAIPQAAEALRMFPSGLLPSRFTCPI